MAIIDDPSAVFQVQLYTGNGSADHAITNTGNSDLQPDIVWIKNRDAGDHNCLFDSTRGVTKLLHPSNAIAEATDADTLDAFSTDGFRVDADDKVNTNAEKYVAWQWKKTAGVCDIVSYTGNGSARNISHSLGVVPKMMIVKNLDTTDKYQIYYGDNTDYLQMQVTDATADNVNRWNDTTPTSSVFTIGNGNEVNTNTERYICYLFANSSMSRVGTWVGNATIANANFVYLPFKPAYVLAKSIDGITEWFVTDYKRHTGINQLNIKLSANTGDAEGTLSYMDLLSNGFKITYSDVASEVQWYIAFAESPFVTSTGVPATAR